jgi:hypothetical protein
MSIELLKPGGVLTMPSWFLLMDAIKGTRLYVTWTVSPPLGIAIKHGGAS